MATTLPSNRRDALAQWWQLHTRSERMLLATAAGIAALALAWLVGWQPLAQDTDRLGRQIENDRATLADARRRADEIAGLARNAPSVAPAALLDARTNTLSDGRLRIANATGTLWQGSGELVLMPAGARQAFSWRLDGWPLLRGEIRATIAVAANGARSTTIAYGRDRL